MITSWSTPLSVGPFTSCWSSASSIGGWGAACHMSHMFYFQPRTGQETWTSSIRSGSPGDRAVDLSTSGQATRCGGSRFWPIFHMQRDVEQIWDNQRSLPNTKVSLLCFSVWCEVNVVFLPGKLKAQRLTRAQETQKAFLYRTSVAWRTSPCKLYMSTSINVSSLSFRHITQPPNEIMSSWVAELHEHLKSTQCILLCCTTKSNGMYRNVMFFCDVSWICWVV